MQAEESPFLQTACDESASVSDCWPSRTLLLVDDEPNILAALKRVVRRDDYRILVAGSGPEGLELLAQHAVDVIVSDQRMPGMTGVEFLRTAKRIYPDTVRIVLSGYTELKSVIDAVNEGAIYKFLTKPWEDQLLRQHIEEAFRRKGMADENRQLNLALSATNQRLAAANHRMEELLEQNEISLKIVREVLQYMPLPVIGVDEENMVVLTNAAAEMLFAKSRGLLGSNAFLTLPEIFDAHYEASHFIKAQVTEVNGVCFQINHHPMGSQSQSRGRLTILTKIEDQVPHG